jgi:hypothetical protein
MKLSNDSIYQYISKANLIIESCEDSLSDTSKLDNNKKKILERLIKESQDLIKSLHYIKEKLNKLNKILNKPTFMKMFENKVDIQEDFNTIQKELITINTKLTNNRLLLNHINNKKKGFNRVKNIVMNNKIAATAIGISVVATTHHLLNKKSSKNVRSPREQNRQMFENEALLEKMEVEKKAAKRAADAVHSQEMVKNWNNIVASAANIARMRYATAVPMASLEVAMKKASSYKNSRYGPADTEQHKRWIEEEKIKYTK